MKERFLSMVHCPEPSCKSSLDIDQKDAKHNGEIMEGMLVCTGCGDEYKLRDGFPMLLPAELDDGNGLHETG